MSDASLNIAFGTTGAQAVQSDIAAVKKAGSELEALEREWLRAKDARAKELKSIYKAEAGGLEERLRQERQARSRAYSEEVKSTSDKDKLLESWLKAKDARAKERANIDKIESSAKIERRRQESQAAMDASRQEEIAWRRSIQAQKEAKKEADRIAKEAKGKDADGISLTDWSIYATGANQALQLVQRVISVGSDLVRETAKWEAYSVALRDIEGSAYGAKNAQQDLYELAKAPGIGFAEAQKTYIQLRAVNIEGEKAKRIIKDVANTVALSGGSSVEFERVNRQLVQMLANGRVLESDLKWMKEAMPRLATVMQDTFGTTSAEGIRKLGLNSEEFLNGILRGMEKLPAATRTLTSEIENAETAWSQFKASFADADFWKGTLRGVTSVLETMTGIMDAGKKHDEAEAFRGRQYLDSDKTLNAAFSGQQKARSDAIIRSMQYSGMTGGIRAEAGPLTGYWADEAKKQAEKERLAAANRKDADDKSAKDKKKKVDKEPFDLAAETQAYEFDKYNRERARLRAFNEQHVGDAPDTKIYGDQTHKSQSGQRYLGYAQLGRKSDDYMREDRRLTEESDKEAEAAAKKRVEDSDAEAKRIEDYKKAVDEKRELRRRANEEEAAELEAKYMSDYERMEAGLASEREMILRNTALTGEQRNQLLKKYDDAALRQRTDYWAANSSLLLTASSDMFGALAETAKKGISENSQTYKTLFTISKSFAIADASLKWGQAVMNAYASQPWPANMAAAASVMAATGGVISSINSMAYSGVYDKGGDIPAGKWGIAGENGPEIIQGPAHVTSTKDTARIMGGTKAPVVNVYNSAGAQVAVKQGQDGSIDLIIEAAARAAEESIAAGVSSGRSPVASVIQSVYGLRR